MEDSDNEEQVPANYNLNIFKVWFYHFNDNGYNDLLMDYGAFRYVLLNSYEIHLE